MSVLASYSLIILAALRVILEFTPLRWSELPLSKKMGEVWGAEQMFKFHRMGFYLSLGYLVLFLPEFFYA